MPSHICFIDITNQLSRIFRFNSTNEHDENNKNLETKRYIHKHLGVRRNGETR